MQFVDGILNIFSQEKSQNEFILLLKHYLHSHIIHTFIQQQNRFEIQKNNVNKENAINHTLNFT